jgi:uncharacterized protein (TIGR00106 family)
MVPSNGVAYLWTMPWPHSDNLIAGRHDIFKWWIRMVENCVIAEFSVVPLGTGDTSLSKYVRKAHEEVVRSGIRSSLTPMGTIIEAESIDRIFEVIKLAHEAVFSAGAKRVSTNIKIDDRRDKKRQMEDKVEAIK